MNDSRGPAGGLMVLRAWTESGGRLRVRLIETADVRSASRSVSASDSAADVVASVTAWLEAVRAAR